MLKKAIKKRIRRYHPWRTIKFDELAEIYISMSLRSVGFSAIGIFVPIYLYKSGVPLVDVIFFLFFFFIFRAAIVLKLGKFVGSIGPKHAIAVSNVFFIAFLFLLLSFESVQWPLPFLALMYTLANGMFFVAYHADFSKIKHRDHGGKELGWLYIFERLGSALGPVIGGLVAGLFSPQVSIIFAIVVIFGSLIPLFMTNEPVKAHQIVDYAKLDKKRIITNDMPSIMSFNVINIVHAAFWPLFIGVFIFVDNTYETLGILIGISMVISILSARLYGKLVDRYQGKQLLQFGVYSTSIINVLRSLISQPFGAVAITSAAEPTELAARLPLVKGYYDETDNHDDLRVAYIAFTEQVTAVAKALFTLLLAIMLIYLNDRASFQVIFMLGAVISFGMLKQNFKALQGK